jgi:hypothetical protein
MMKVYKIPISLSCIKLPSRLPIYTGVALQGCVGGGGHPPTRQQIGKLLSQSAKLDWLKITTEETKIDFLNNSIQTEYHD